MVVGSLLLGVLLLEAQAPPPSAGRNKRERRGHLLKSHSQGRPAGSLGSVGLGSDLHNLGTVQAVDAFKSEVCTHF